MSKINQVAAGLATIWKKPGLTRAAATLAAVLSTIAFTLNVHHKYGKAKTEGIKAAMKGTYDSVTVEDVSRLEKLSEKNTSAMKREIARSKKEIRKVKQVVDKTATEISKLPEQMRTIVQEEIHSSRKEEALKREKIAAGVTANPTKSEKDVTGVAANSHLPMVQEEVQLKTVMKSVVHSTTVHDLPKFDVREGKDGGLVIVVSSELALKQMVQRKININEVLKSLKELVKTES